MKIVYIPTAATGAAYQVAIISKYQAMAAEKGFELVVMDPEFDAQKQVDCVGNAVAQGCDAIMIAPNDPSSLVNVCTEAQQADIPIITIGGEHMEDSHYGVSWTSHVGCNDEEASTKAGEEMAKNLQAGDKVAFFCGTAGTVQTANRAENCRKILEEAGVEIIDVKNTTAWSNEEAYATAEDWCIKYPEINGVFCHWDTGLKSITEAFKAAGRLDGMVNGSIDGCKDGFDLVRNGTSVVCMMQDMDSIVTDSINACYALKAGEEVEQYIYAPYIAVTKDNIDQYEPFDA